MKQAVVWVNAGRFSGELHTVVGSGSQRSISIDHAMQEVGDL